MRRRGRRAAPPVVAAGGLLLAPVLLVLLLPNAGAAAVAMGLVRPHLRSSIPEIATPSVPSYKTFQQPWRVKVFYV